MTKAENIRRAAPVLLALVEELRERKANERAGSPVGASPAASQGRRGDLSEDAA